MPLYQTTPHTYDPIFGYMRGGSYICKMSANLTDEAKANLAQLLSVRSDIVDMMEENTSHLIDWYKDNVDEVRCTTCNESKILREVYKIHRENGR